VDDVRCVRAGNALGHVVGRFGACLPAAAMESRRPSPGASRLPIPFAAANVGTPLGVPLHPTQLYEAGAEFLILMVLLGTERKGRPFAGRTFWMYMLLYAISRFIIEFYRGDRGDRLACSRPRSSSRSSWRRWPS